MRRLIPLLALAALLAIVPLAAAHPERTTVFPDHTKGSTPKLRDYKGGGRDRIVCKPDSGRLVRRIFRGQRRLLAERLRQVRDCRYRHVQAAVDAARSGDDILLMPGVYREEPSTRVPADRPEGECGPMEVPDDGDAPVPTYQYQHACPNARNLIAILGDRDPDDERRACDQKCRLLIRGMGRRPTDVLLVGDRRKRDVLRGDRADGIVLFNFAVEQGAFNNIDLVETNGFRIERVVARYGQNYGVLTFASDNGLYRGVEAYGNGDSGVYPGSGPEGHCRRYGIIIERSNVHDNNMGFSGTAGNGTWYRKNRFHHNGAGGANDSFASGHPGMPQDCSKWTENHIYSNNRGDFYDDAHDRYCASTPFERRRRTYVCPQFQIPVGTGIALFGANGNRIERNWIYDQWRDGVRQFYVPAAVRGEMDPAKQQDTSHQNVYRGNHMGVRPDGTRDPNGLDFFWDEQGRGNCWESNGRFVTSDPRQLPACPGSPVLLPGSAEKFASQVPCVTWDPRANPNPPGCDWFVAPPEPRR